MPENTIAENSKASRALEALAELKERVESANPLDPYDRWYLEGYQNNLTDFLNQTGEDTASVHRFTKKPSPEPSSTRSTEQLRTQTLMLTIGGAISTVISAAAFLLAAQEITQAAHSVQFLAAVTGLTSALATAATARTLMQTNQLVKADKRRDAEMAEQFNEFTAISAKAKLLVQHGEEARAILDTIREKLKPGYSGPSPKGGATRPPKGFHFSINLFGKPSLIR